MRLLSKNNPTNPYSISFRNLLTSSNGNRLLPFLEYSSTTLLTRTHGVLPFLFRHTNYSHSHLVTRTYRLVPDYFQSKITHRLLQFLPHTVPEQALCFHHQVFAAYESKLNQKNPKKTRKLCVSILCFKIMSQNVIY